MKKSLESSGHVRFVLASLTIFAVECMSFPGLLAQEDGAVMPFMSSGTQSGPIPASMAAQAIPLRRDQPEGNGAMETDGGMMGSREGMKDVVPGDAHAGHHVGSGKDPSPEHPGMGNMMSMGQSEGDSQSPDRGDAGCCGGRGQTPLYTFLVTHPTLTESERQILAVEAARRIQQGRALVGDTLVDIGQALSLQAMRDNSQHLHEGLSLLESGMAARAAANGLASPQQIAFNWFDGQMGLPFRTQQEQGFLFGLAPAHLLFMAVLILVSIGLLVLQALRLHRVQEILRTTQGSPGPSSMQSPPPSNSAGPSNPPHAPVQPSSPGGAAASSVKTQSEAARTGPWRGTLKVAQKTRETSQIVTFSLIDPDGGQIPFDFFPGQFVQLGVDPTVVSPAAKLIDWLRPAECSFHF